MDLGGLLGMDMLVYEGAAASSSSSSLKHGRALNSGGEGQDWSPLKVARTEGEQMLSFCNPPSADALPYYHLPAQSPGSCGRNAGLVSESTNMGMQGVLARVRGPFTPSQWMELEHQALIYKYIDAKAPIPSSLLLPIRRTLSPSTFSAYSNPSFRSTSLGWESFHLGFTGNADPEPGRCRRTDGKKWRCSRDAVADGKYCERHMNRGRERSRKHVEGRLGQTSKAMSTNSLTTGQQPDKNLQTSIALPSTTKSSRSSVMIKGKGNGSGNGSDPLQDLQGPSMLSTISSKSLDTGFTMPTKEHIPFGGTSARMDFGLVASGSIPNPPKNSSQSTHLISSQEPHDRQRQDNSLRHFIDDWPRNSITSNVTWPDDELQSDRTQLSISIPMASDFSSSTSSPNQEKLSLSPLKLSREFDPIHMGLGVGGGLNGGTQSHRSWIPISWEASLGGPLGEVLTNTNNTPKDTNKNFSSSSLNLLTEGWDNSPRLSSSPTGVLQKTTFGSLSSSAGSSPRVEHLKAHDGTSSLCDDLLGSTFVNGPTIPLL